MYENLKKYCADTVSFTAEELILLNEYFETIKLGKKEFLLKDQEICRFVGFIDVGTIRHFHVKDGDEKTCDISFENTWVTDFQSFNNETPCIMNLQAMEPTVVNVIQKDRLMDLYKRCPAYETFGRKMAERVAQRATDIAMSLSSSKPEERFLNLLDTQPNIFQRIPQKYIANFLGVSPESLSRIRKRVHDQKS